MAFWTTERLKRSGRRIIKPFEPAQVVNCAYELTLGGEGYVTSEGKKIFLKEKQEIKIPPGEFALLLTEEVLEIPPDALGLISIRASVKLKGLINVSGFHVDPGFRGRLIFSVYNAGGSPVVISRGDRVFLLWLAALERETKDVYAGTHRLLDSLPSKTIEDIGSGHFNPAEVNNRLTSLEVQVRTTNRVLIGLVIAGSIAIGSMFLERIVFPDPVTTEQTEDRDSEP